MTIADPVADDRPTLGSVVGDGEHFLQCVFGRAPWRGHTDDADQPFGVDDVDRIVASAARVPAVRMVRDGKRVPPDQYCTPTRIGSTQLDDVADARKILDQFRRGATLVLQSLHRTWSPMSVWCAALEREIGWPVQANAYLTPAQERGLAPHADGHDVFALQLHGTKRWEVDELGALELTVGDVLYLPAGITHRAETGEQASLHLTIGVHRPTAERIARTSARMATQRAALRVGTPPDAAMHLLREGLREIEASDVVDHLRRPPRSHTEGLLASAVTRPRLDADTLIAPVGKWTVDRLDGRVMLEWQDGRLWLPDRAAHALFLLADRGRPTPIGALDGLDPDEQMVMARRLLDEGAATDSAATANVAAANMRSDNVTTETKAG